MTETQNVGDPMVTYTCKCGFRYEVVDFIDFDKKCPECEFHWEEEIFQVIQRVKNRENIKNKKIDPEEIVFNLYGAKKDGADPNEAYEQIVSYFKSMYFPKVMRDDRNEEVWIYLDGIYMPEGKSYLIEIMRDCLGKLYSKKHFNTTLNRVVADCFVDPNDFFNSNIEDSIPVLNGILNIFNKKLSDYSPEKIFFNKIPVRYDPKKECPKIKKFFGEIVKEEDVKLLSEFIGFSLYKKYYLNKSFILTGNGRNGKSTYLDLINHFIGKKNTSSLTLEDMKDSSSFDIVELHNKMINLAGDIGKKKLDDTALFKSLTGTEQIKANRKFLSPLYFVNYAKFIFSCNEIPRTADDSEGFFRRWVIIDFPYKFVPKNEYRQEEKNWKIDTPGIISQLYDNDELSGLLNLALESFNNIYKNKRFSDDSTVENITKEWKRKSNNVLVFCDDNISESFDSFIVKEELLQKYNEYCSKYNIKPQSERQFFSSVRKLFDAKDERKMVAGKRKYIFSGIKVKEKDKLPTLPISEGHFTPICSKQGKALKGESDRQHRQHGQFLDQKSNKIDNNIQKTTIDIERYFDMAYDQVKTQVGKNTIFVQDIADKIEFDESVLAKLISDGKYFEPRPGYIQRL